MQAYEKLEQQWAEFNGLDPAGMVACSSGTAALHLALEALPNCTRYLLPNFTMVACARAVVLAGGLPGFLDCDDKLLMDFALLPRGNGVSRCIMPVHIYGRRCDMAQLQNWRANWPSSPTFVVEDLAEAHGIKPHPATDAACWSFYSNKIVHGEEGGAVWFRNLEHAALARQLRCLGFTDAHDFMHVPRGHNYRMSNMHATVILDSIKRYCYNISRRRALESWYDGHMPLGVQMPARDVPWVYDIKLPGYVHTTELVRVLNHNGIAARLAFKPMTLQPEFSTALRYGGNNAVEASNSILYLPLDKPDLQERALAIVLSALQH